MSLLKDAMEKFVFVERRSTPDGEGGFVPSYVDGAIFEAFARLDSSTESEIAKAQGVTSLYTIITSTAVNLQQKDVIRRTRDNKYFRITSDGDDDKVPESATIHIRKGRAEEWELPHD